MIGLKHPYISVAYEGGNSFGGSQRLSGNSTLASCGCGVIAAADLLLYISAWHKGHCYLEMDPERANSIKVDAYRDWVNWLRKKYFPLIPHFGMNGLGLMAGMQLFFKHHALPYSCVWCLSDRNLWEKVREMLDNDIPVIMSIGPNFPRVWKHGAVNLYSKKENGEYVATSSVKAHFITVTAIDDEWLEVSSWGRVHYINRRKYEEFVSKYSAAFVSNILYVKKKQD